MNTQQNNNRNTTKGRIIQIIGYVLFGVATFMIIGMFYNSSLMGRSGKYHEKDVFPLYEKYDENKEYLDAYVTVSNGFYDKTPIYTYTQNDGEASDLLFTLNIYRARFTRVSYKLYFFPKKVVGEGYVIEIADLQYKKSDGTFEDLMQFEREYDTKEKYLFKIYPRFDRPLAESITKNAKVDDGYVISPMYPAIFETTGILRDGEEGRPELVELHIARVYVDEETGKETNYESLFIVNSDGGMEHHNVPREFPIFVHDLTAKTSDYTFTKAEISGDMPTATEAQNLGLSYEELDLSKYNGSVIVTTLIIGLIILLTAYFMFFNKFVVAKVQQRKRAKEVAASTVKSLEPKTSMEAQYKENSKSLDSTLDAPVINADIEASDNDDNNLS